MSIKSTIIHIIKCSLIKISILKNINIKLLSVEVNSKDIGIYTTDIAITLSKYLKLSPYSIANSIIDNLDYQEVADISLEGSGLIIFRIKETYLIDKVKEIIKYGTNYGKNNLGNKETININYITSSPNLNTKELTSIIYLDTIARIMTLSNYNVTKEYYLALENTEILPTLKQDLDKYRINIDSYLTLNYLYKDNLIDNTLDTLKYNNYCYIKDDYLSLKLVDDTRDKILINNDGTYTSLTTDIAYYLDKINNNSNRIISILNNDNENINIVKSIIKMLEKNNKITKKIVIPNNNFTMDELKNLDINTIRYLLILSTKNTDNYLSLDINNLSNNNPYHYIESTNILIHSILKKYKTKNNVIIDNDITYIIMNKLIEFESVIIEATKNKEPVLIADYTYTLSKLFNSYYKELLNNIEENITLIEAIKIVLNNALDLLGIIPREEL